MAAAGYLSSLEALMTEFYDVNTSNARKQEIEAQLNNFSQQNDAWRHCLIFIEATKNQFVQMYALTVLQNLVSRRWVSVEMREKLEITRSLRSLVFSNRPFEVYVVNKIIKLIVDIGKLDWPFHYPNYFSDIVEVMQDVRTCHIGLAFLLTTCEEFATPRDDLSRARREELMMLLTKQLPETLNLLTVIIESSLSRSRIPDDMVTPPPSPTSSNNNVSPAVQDPNVIADQMLSKYDSGAIRLSVRNLDEQSGKLIYLSLNCICHIFSWAPPSHCIQPKLIQSIFCIASIGVDPQVTATPVCIQLANHALVTINEIVGRNFVPRDFGEFYLHIFSNSFELMRRISLANQQAVAPAIDSEFITKFTELLSLFVSVHLRRFELNPEFPMIEFLSLLFDYTFNQPSNDGFLICLDIWSIFFDYLGTKMTNRVEDRTAVLARYEKVLRGVVVSLVGKFQFRSNQARLEELDDETLSDDEVTEWQSFLKECNELVAKVAVIIPEYTVAVVEEQWRLALGVYCSLDRYVTASENGTRLLAIPGENGRCKLHCTLRDLASLTQTLGRLSEYSEGLSDTLVVALFGACDYSVKHTLWSASNSTETALNVDFVEVHAQLLAALKAFHPWLSRVYLEESTDRVYHLIRGVMEGVYKLIRQDKVPLKIVHSAVHLLVSIATSVRPRYFVSLDSMFSLYEYSSTPEFVERHTEETKLLVYRGLTNALVLPWPGVPESRQDWPDRSAHHARFVARIAAAYLALEAPARRNDSAALARGIPCIAPTLGWISDQVTALVGQSTRCKQVVWNSVKPATDLTVLLVSALITHAEVIDSIMSFYLALFQSLRSQMGVAYIEETVKMIMGLFDKDQLYNAITNEGSIGCKIVEKFLSLLTIVAQEPGSAYISFLPSIIGLCTEQIHPIVANHPSHEVQTAVYTLLYQLVSNRWRFFFKSSILATLLTHPDQVEHENLFLAIMQVFGQSFMQSDIELFRLTLSYLQDLNFKWKLYSKDIFRRNLLDSFLRVLFQLLLTRSHDLLREDIASAVADLAFVDKQLFFSCFLPQLLDQTEGLDSPQKSSLLQSWSRDDDIPTFQRNLDTFVTDFRYFIKTGLV